jgi:hypothetical protein
VRASRGVQQTERRNAILGPFLTGTPMGVSGPGSAARSVSPGSGDADAGGGAVGVVAGEHRDRGNDARGPASDVFPGQHDPDDQQCDQLVAEAGSHPAGSLSGRSPRVSSKCGTMSDVLGVLVVRLLQVIDDELSLLRRLVCQREFWFRPHALQSQPDQAADQASRAAPRPHLTDITRPTHESADDGNSSA